MANQGRKIIPAFQYNINLIKSMINWKSARAIGKEFGVSERTVYRYIKELKEVGFKIGHKKFNGQSKYKIQEAPESFKGMISELNEVIKLPVINSVESMLNFIDSLRETDPYISAIYLNGGCYQFHLLLKKFAPECESRINQERNHIVTKFKGKFFDINGIAKGGFYPLDYSDLLRVSKWSFHKNRLINLGECPQCEEPLTV